MNRQKQIAVIINALAILAVIFLNRTSFISLIAITLMMVLNFWNLLSLKEKKILLWHIIRHKLHK